MNFDQYKDRLIEYLSLKGINAHTGLIRCFAPDHDDKNPSCELWKDHFTCYSGKCGIHGDIYDAVEILEGITDKKDQFKLLEKVFGNPELATPAKAKKEEKEKEQNFVADPKALDEIETQLKKNKSAEKAFKSFWDERANISTDGKIKAYPLDYKKLSQDLLYWPGMDIIRKEIDSKILRAAGIPLTNPNTGKCSWEHSGVIVRLGHGLKLHFYQNKSCEKRGTKCCSTFPMPGSPDLNKRIILVEGEIDAIVCKAAGIENVFSAGGTNGLTGPKIQSQLLDAKEIILLFDNDESGRKASGVIPFEDKDKRKTSLPEIFEKAGYKGTLKIAKLEGPYKDPDEAILHGALHIVQEAIKNAKVFGKETIPEMKEQSGNYITNKELHALLKRLPYSTLEAQEIEKFIGACRAAVPECTSETFEILQEWGATEYQLKQRVRQPAQFLLAIAKKYHLSYYYTSKLEKAFLSKKDLEKLASGSQPIIDIDFEKLKSQSLDNFVFKKGVKTGAMIIANLLQHKLICIENEKNNPFYFYNGHIWIREPDPWGMAYNILLAVTAYKIKQCAEADTDKKDILKKTLTKLEERKFRNDIVKDLSVASGIFQKQILFDSPIIKETLTLQDGVMDFSGRKIIYRNSKPEEYRRETLPYSVDQIMNAKEPKKFLAFMSGNFKNEETLETFLFYLSLIASRCTQYKYGGIFIGRPHTGKTTTIELLMKIYQNMIVRLPSEKLVSKGRNYGANGPDPYIARLIGKGAAVAQETERNGYLNNAIWKEMTGGDTLTARDMYVSPIDFIPTAQIIMASNHIPRFDNKDQATIDRMVIIPFLVEHKHGDKETKEQSDIIKDLEDEYPAIVKLLAEYYIKFKYIHKGKLPLSPECAAYKEDYIQQQETDLDFFVENNIDFKKNEEWWEPIKDVYARYLSYFSYAVDINGKPTDKEAWSQSKFTRIMKHDYPEIRTKQKKINGYPKQIFLYLKLKPDTGQKGEKPLNTEDLNSSSFKDEEEENPFE